jgi:hypothetical protein
MTETKTEEVSAKLMSVSQEQKRVMFIFENPRDPEKELKFSAFEPNLPKLQIGKWYQMTVEHKPTGDGRFYHNLVRASKDGPYIIKEIQPALPNTAKFQAATDYPKITQVQAEIRREACLNSALVFHKDARLDKDLKIEDILRTAEAMENWVKGAKP